MTTTELIKLLKSIEHGASGRSREISFKMGKEHIFEPSITVSGTGDGICGAEVCLEIVDYNGKKKVPKECYEENDPRAMKDCVLTLKMQESNLYHGMAQGFTPVFKHQRICYVWQGFNGVQQVVSVNTETLIVRPRIKNM